MGINNGSVLATTLILDNGPSGERFNLVILAEGFTNAQQNTFNDLCFEFVEHIQNHLDFEPVSAAINVHRVNVASNESGAANPVNCANDDPDESGSGVNPETYFDATYCGDGELRRFLIVDDELAMDTATEQVPQWNSILVIVNDNKSGGTGGGCLSVIDLSDDWHEVALHEIGHTVFGLADEYPYRKGIDTHEPGQNLFDGPEPFEPNITTITERHQLKWASYVRSTTLVPTMQNSDCTSADQRENVLNGAEATEIGLFEGAGYHHCGLYRPAYSCIMANSSQGRFCRVCRDVIHNSLRLFLPPTIHLNAHPNPLHFGTVSQNQLETRTIELTNSGYQPITNLEVTLDTPQFALENVPASISGGDTIAIEITLLPQFGDGSIQAPLLISADNVSITAQVIAEVCSTNPISQIRVNGELQVPLNFGDVVQGVQTFRAFTIINYSADIESLCGAPLTVVLPQLNAPFNYEIIPENAIAKSDGSYEFTIAAPNSETPLTEVPIVVGFHAPDNQMGVITSTIVIDSNAEETPGGNQLEMRAKIVDDQPLNVSLVIDRSGSMGTELTSGRPIQVVAIDAANLFVDMLRSRHRISMVRYNDDSTNPEDVLLPLSNQLGATDSAARSAAHAALVVENLTSSGGTSIGAGMLTGLEVLEADPDERRIMVVLTDGRQNTGIDIPTARNEIDNRVPRPTVFAVGIGLDQYQREINEIASVENGAAYVTGELEDQNEFMLQKMYAQIVTDTTSGAIIRDPVYQLLPSQRRATSIEITALDHEVDFVVPIRPTQTHPKYTRVWIESPSGQMIDHNVANTLVHVEFKRHDAHIRYRIVHRPGVSWEGEWKVWVVNAAALGSRNNLHYSVIAAARKTSVMLGGRVWQPELSPGSPIIAFFEPRMGGIPAQLYGPAVARIERPDGIVQSRSLVEHEEGIYAVALDDTSVVGCYSISAEVQLSLGRRRPVTRFRHLTATILPYPRQTLANPCKNRNCDCEDNKESNECGNTGKFPGHNIKAKMLKRLRLFLPERPTKSSITSSLRSINHCNKCIRYKN